MSEQLKRLIDKQNRLWSRMQEIQQAAETDNRDWTAEERTNWDAANDEITTVSGDIDRLERAAELNSVDYRQVIGDNAPPSQVDEEARYSEAFGLYMRSGFDRMSPEQRGVLQTRAATDPQATTPGNVGGYLIPPGYRQTMTEALKAFGGIINLANVITTSTGNPLQWPTNDDTANKGSILAENTQITVNQVLFGTKTLGAYMYTSNLVLVSYQLLQDSVFDLDTWLPRKLGERLGRGTSDHLINGTGTGQPEGVATNAVTGATAPTNATLTYDNIIDLEHSIDPAYRAGGRCRFLFADSTLGVLRKLKDTQNRPLWLPVPVPGMPATINGVPYTIDQGMPTVGALKKSILFGDFNEGYVVRQVLDMQMVRLAERYADYLQVGFFGFTRLDAKPDNAGAIRALAHPA